MASIKEQMAAQAKLEKEREIKAALRKELEEKLVKEKCEKSAAMFKNTKIASCNSILSKNG